MIILDIAVHIHLLLCVALMPYPFLIHLLKCMKMGLGRWDSRWTGCFSLILRTYLITSPNHSSEEATQEGGSVFAGKGVKLVAELQVQWETISKKDIGELRRKKLKKFVIDL